MKNNILIATIVATTSLSTVAFAQIDAQIKGKYEFRTSYVTNKAGNAQSIQFGQDWEFELSGDYKLDNGVTVFGDFEIDAQGETENVRTDDISFGFKSAYGKITFGTFSNNKHGSASLVPTPITDNMTYKVSDVAKVDFASLDDTDANAIAYKTPTVNGFNAVLGYRTDNEATSDKTVGQTNNVIATNSDFGETVNLGLGYKTSIDNTLIKLGGSYTQGIGGKVTGDTEYLIGTEIGYDNFGATVSYAILNDDSADKETTKLGGDVSYKTGVWKFEAGYSMSDQEHDNNVKTYLVKANYALGPGVTLSAFTAHSNLDDKTSANADDHATQYGIGATIKF